jgi:hypothetical protein
LARLTTEKNRASAFSLIFSVGIGTGALGSVVCGYLPQWLNLAGFALQPAEVKRMILIASCAIAALGLIPLLHLRMPSENSEMAAAEGAAGQPWKLSPFLMCFLPSMALWSAAVAAFTPFASVYFAKDLHISMSRIGLIFSASQLIQLCLGLLTPLVFRWLGLLNGIVATQVFTAIALLCLAGTHNQAAAVALFLGFSATQWMSSPGLYNLLMSKVPDDGRSSAAAMTLFSNALFQSCATAGAGVLLVRFGYPPVLVGISAVALIAALLFKFVVAPVDRIIIRNE